MLLFSLKLSGKFGDHRVKFAACVWDFCKMNYFVLLWIIWKYYLHWVYLWKDQDMFIIETFKIHDGGWRNDSAVTAASFFDLCLVPSIHTRELTTAFNCSSRKSDTLFCFLQALTHTGKLKISKPFKKRKQRRRI